MTIAVFLVSFTSPFSQLWADEEKNAPPPASSRSGSGADVEAGKAIYFKRCVYCHGEQGKGDGFSTDFLRPRPRDFTRGLYKYRTTALKALPTDEDLFKVVTDGLPGTGMPAWSTVLSEQDRRDVIAFIKTFSDRFKSETAPKPLAVGKEPAPNAEMIAKGEKLFHSKATCFMCHGQAGRGDGPLAPTLKDDWGDPISPRNLTKTWQYRGGQSATDIFTRISTGINGTPMPSFAEQLTEEERWQVVQYVKSIQKQNPDVQPVVLKGVRIDGPLPTEPDDPKWGEAPLIRYPLVGQVIREPRMFKPSITDIEVKALYNDKELALLLAWDDPTQTQPNPAGGVFEDAVAVQFPTALT
ncbi:MAG TPA: c-type cytochrome, partial [Candidatus Manganitrophaceae bacterium]